MIAIQAPENPPAPEPGDRALLRPLSTLGKEQSAQPVVSFLRRSEYISADQKALREANAALKARSRHTQSKQRSVDNPQPERDDPARENPGNILRTIVKGFDIAHPDSAYTGPDTADHVRGYDPTPEELDAWNNPQHPSRKDLKLVDSFPILPDLDACPDTGGYILIKFATNPGGTTDRYDERLEHAILRPLELRPELQAAHDALVAAHAADPSKPAAGPPPFDYELLLPHPLKAKDEKQSQEESQSQERAQLLEKVRQKFDFNNPHRDDPALYFSENKQLGLKTLGYKSVRAYETATTTAPGHPKFSEVALALYDPDQIRGPEADGEGAAPPRKKQKAAYYYPILQKTQIRPRRSNVQPSLMGGGTHQDEEAAADLVHRLEITVGDPDEAELRKRVRMRREYDPTWVSTMEDTTKKVPKEELADDQ